MMEILCDETVLELRFSKFPEVRYEAWAECIRRGLVSDRDVFAAEAGA